MFAQIPQTKTIGPNRSPSNLMFATRPRVKKAMAIREVVIGDLEITTNTAARKRKRAKGTALPEYPSST